MDRVVLEHGLIHMLVSDWCTCQSTTSSQQRTDPASQRTAVLTKLFETRSAQQSNAARSTTARVPRVESQVFDWQPDHLAAPVGHGEGGTCISFARGRMS